MTIVHESMYKFLDLNHSLYEYKDRTGVNKVFLHYIKINNVRKRKHISQLYIMPEIEIFLFYFQVSLDWICM